MKKLNNPLIKNSLAIFWGAMIVNVCNYLFHLISGRLLGPIEYGILASLNSILYIISIPSLTIHTAITKFVSQYKAQRKESMIYSLWWYFSKKLFLVGMLLFLLFSTASKQIASYLNLPTSLLVIFVSLPFLLIFLLSVNRGVIIGLQRFNQLSFNNATEAILKLILSVILIIIGFRVYGAIFAIFLATFLAYLLSFVPIKSIFGIKKHKENKIDTSTIKNYSLFAFAAFALLTLIYNLDIILVKHYFTESQAGLYAALSTTGKIIIFATASITNAMFPMAVNSYYKKEDHGHLLKKSLFLTFGFGTLILLAFFFAPGLIMRMFFGSKYLEAAQYLPLFGIFAFLFSLINVFINYDLSIHRTKFIYILAPAVISEIVLITLYHASITQIVLNLIFVMLLLACGLIIINFVRKRDE